MASRGRSNAFKLAVLGVALLLGLGVVEAAFRYRAWKLNRESLESAFEVPPDTPAVQRTRFCDMIRPSPNDRIIYELRPNLDVEFSGARVHTNDLGFRGPDVPLQADEGTITIVGIGASIMFGYGVADDENFLAVTGELLRRRHPERSWRTINTAVPSYNVVTKVEVLEEKGLQFHPDLVILGIANNNLDLPNYVRIDEDPLDLGRSFLLDFFRERRAIEDETARRDSVLAAVNKEKLSWHAQVASDPSRIPERYRDLVGWEPFRRAMDELARTSLEQGFEVVCVANLDLDISAQMLDEARQRGFHTLMVMDDLRDFIDRQYHEEFTLERYQQSALVVNKANAHPSALQHRMIANRIERLMTNSGLIDRLYAKVPPPSASPQAAGTATR